MTENVNGDLDTTGTYGVEPEDIECETCQGAGWECNDCWGTGMVEVDQ